MADITFQQLLLGTQRVLPTTIARKDQDLRVFNTRVSNFEGTNMKVFNTNVMSSIGRKSYNVSLAFYNVVDKSNLNTTNTDTEINNENEENNNQGYTSVFDTKLTDTANTVENAVPSLTTMRVGVRCSCSAYYFWFSYANTKAKANYGARFRTYIRKTPPYPEGYPPKNPALIPGVCKHIIHFVEELRADGLVQ